MSTQTAHAERASYQLVVIGAVLPAIFTIINTRLQGERTVLPFMAALVVEVGLLGVMCGKLIRPLWLALVIYGWAWVVMDLPVLALAMQDQWPWVLISGNTLPAALLSGQQGLVIVWLVLGQVRWSTRCPAALMLATAAFVPLVWHKVRPTEFLIMLALQTGFLAVACMFVRWRGVRLVRVYPDRVGELVSDRPAERLSRPSQFRVRDVLIWMTALALALAAARAAGYWPALVEAWQHVISGVSGQGVWAILLPTPRTGLLSSAVLMLALWAALGPGRLGVRLMIFLSCTLVVAAGSSLLDFQRSIPMWIPSSIWDVDFWQVFWHMQWPEISWLTLSGGMLYAALLFPRALGYRLAKSET